MPRTIHLEISNEVYTMIRRLSEESGKTPSGWLSALLETKYGLLNKRGAFDKPKAGKCFESHFGAIDFGYPTGIENESIDEDIAREYSDTHEEAV